MPRNFALHPTDGRSSAKRRAGIFALNSATKRKYPKGYDCKSRLWNIWRAMHSRCYSKSHKAYPKYGGAGIVICPAWRAGYGNFLDWALQAGYRDDLEIDRIDNAKGYEPQNCRWVTRRQNQENRGVARLVSAFGETKTIGAWAKDARCVASWSVLYRRIAAGWNPTLAITTPSNARGRSAAGLYRKLGIS